jgi:hypothetical protein
MREYDNSQLVNEGLLTVESSLDAACKQYIRPRMDYLRNYEINIRFLSLGCIVSIGCKNVAFSSIEEAMQEVNAYVADPRSIEEKYNRLFNEQ